MSLPTTLRRDPNFTWLMSGGVISALGDQFTLIALPWLVLQLTGDPLMLGVMVAVMGVPRAILILFGGALVDRYSPKRVLMLTKHANTLLLAILAALVLSGQASLPLVALLAIGLSLASAFSIPAGTSMLPHAVPLQLLGGANAAMMGMRQLTMLAGPLLAGLLFVLAGDGSAGSGDARGLGLAFAFDALTYLVSAWTLSKVRPLPAPAQDKAAPEPVLRAVGAGLATVWRDPRLRTAFLYWGLCACVIGGLMQVGLPLLASERLHGASALALLMGAHGAGALAGMALSGVLGKRRVVNLGITLLLVDGIAGLLLVPLGMVTESWQGMLLLVAMGVLGGFVQVAVFTWLQQSVPKAMLGRMMSIFMFVFMGLAPLSAAVAGWLASFISLATLFMGAGLFLTVAALLAWQFTPMARLADATPAAQQG
ncbi:MFS transporter [Massilia yuzhufengensis]|uniref:MFS-type transporter involved in bile tolerance, Atg22 family n=1 Tax=Massilia yuzhufengensis TaxID=1164594 RepID=A0A1I1F3W5_9BURK|nr:MFS transporter [Massilia yuzhufengensis]SFB92438.1 MFS-type transporter involved in bile tolerance, Atg22 family [Massilia yuzhufengensis]